MKLDAETEKNAEALYQAYPKHVARGAALKAIRAALRKESFEVLLEAVNAYAESRVGQDKIFTPHPATWFNQERWSDDRSQWSHNSVGGTSASRRQHQIGTARIHGEDSAYAIGERPQDVS